jgi:hypothetical protein
MHERQIYFSKEHFEGGDFVGIDYLNLSQNLIQNSIPPIRLNKPNFVPFCFITLSPIVTKLLKSSSTQVTP